LARRFLSGIREALNRLKRGAVLFQHASRILKDVREAKEAVLALSNQPAGNVTIGMTPGISDLLTTKLVESCNRDCPAIRLNVEQDLSAATSSNAQVWSMTGPMPSWDGRAVGNETSNRATNAEFLGIYIRGAVNLSAFIPRGERLSLPISSCFSSWATTSLVTIWRS
jgi:hypothetical protein